MRLWCLSRSKHSAALHIVSPSPIIVTFTWKDYRHDASVALMTLSPAEFMCRFLLHVLPDALANPPLRLSRILCGRPHIMRYVASAFMWRLALLVPSSAEN